MRGLLAIAAVVGCSHAHHQPAGEQHASSHVVPDVRRASADTAKAAEARPLTFAARCVPNMLRLAVRADIEPGRSSGADQIEFLRPLCIVTSGVPACRVRPDMLQVVSDRGSFHGERVAVLSVIYSAPQLTITLDGWDESTSLSDAAEFSEGMAALEDGCVKIQWSSNGVGTLKAVRGELVRADDTVPWTFRPVPTLCAADHRPGDDHVFDAPLPVTGKATKSIPVTGLSGVYLSGTLQLAQHGFSVVADSFLTAEWRRQ